GRPRRIRAPRTVRRRGSERSRRCARRQRQMHVAWLSPCAYIHTARIFGAVTFTLYVKESLMPTTSVYPVLMCSEVTAAADFFRNGFGFDTTFATDWYVSLRSGDHELALLAHDHATVPESHRALAQGVIINV